MKFTVTIFLAFVVSSSLAQSADSYTQVVRRDDVSFGQGLKGTKGILTLGRDSIVFMASSNANSEIDFRLPYTGIARVKRYRGIILPNRIGIETRDGRTYRIFTYKRKKILDILDSRTE